MRQPPRTILAACLAALHLALSLCGPGHHDAHGGPPDGQHEAIGLFELAAAAPSDDDSHCPACDYCTLSAIPAEMAPAIRPAREAPPGRPRGPSSHHLARIRGPSIPRAPPRPLAIELLPGRPPSAC